MQKEKTNKSAAREAGQEAIAMLRVLATSELSIDSEHNRTPARLALRDNVWRIIEAHDTPVSDHNERMRIECEIEIARKEVA